MLMRSSSPCVGMCQAKMVFKMPHISLLLTSKSTKMGGWSADLQFINLKFLVFLNLSCKFGAVKKDSGSFNCM